MSLGKVTDDLDRYASFGIHVLELVAVFVGLLLAAGTVVSLLKSIWEVTIRGRIVVFPFEGGEKAAPLGRALSQQWIRIEREWSDLAQQISKEEPGTLSEHPPGFVDVGARKQPEAVPRGPQLELLVNDPVTLAIPPMSMGGFSFSPDALLQVLSRVRGAMAHRTVKGTLQDLGDTLGASVVIKISARTATVRYFREALSSEQLSDIVSDLAFDLAKLRLGQRKPTSQAQPFESSAATWRGYRSFLEAYFHHMRFERTARTNERESAVTLYEQALVREPDYALAHYNLGTLLYSRYLEPENERAIVSFQAAAKSLDEELRALALAGLALAYCQRVHRFGHAPPPKGSVPSAARQGPPPPGSVWFHHIVHTCLGTS